MVFAVVYGENSDIVATYESHAEALEMLAVFIDDNPTLQDDIGLRPYANGSPAGPWVPASEVLGDRIAQRHMSV